MFIGRLSNYYQFLKEIEEVLKKYDPGMKVDENNKDSELFIEEENYPEEFFIDHEQDLKLETNYIINNFNMTQFEINVAEKGVNLFDIAIDSHFFLTNSMTGKIVK